MVAGMFGMFFLGALYLQRVLGYDAIEIGLALPAGGAADRRAVAALRRPADHCASAAAAVLVPGLVLIAPGLAWFARAPVDASYVVDLLPAMLLLGLGAGLSFPALMTLAMSGATESDAGLASGLINTTLQVGGALGLAVLATLSTARTEDLRAERRLARSRR